MSLAASEVAWLQNLLGVLGLQQTVTPLMLCDNLSAVCLSANPRFHKRTKHFEVDYHYVRERVALKKLEVKHISASLQLADIFTKSLPQEPFFKLRSKLGVSVPLTLSLRGCKGPKDSETPVLRESSVHLNGPSDQKENKPISDDCITVMKTKYQSLQARSKCGQSTAIPAHGFKTSNRFDALNPCANVC